MGGWVPHSQPTKEANGNIVERDRGHFGTFSGLSPSTPSPVSACLLGWNSLQCVGVLQGQRPRFWVGYSSIPW